MALVQPSHCFFSTCFRWILELFLWLLLLAQVDGQNNRNEVQTLADFKKSIQEGRSDYGLTENGRSDDRSGEFWSSWNESDENPCAWVGVTCTPNFTVLQLDLSGWGLTQLSSVDLKYLSNLHDLRQLDLSSNDLGTVNHFHEAPSIPEEIGLLTGLTRLNLSRNKFPGEIPQNISSCRKLEYISLEKNALTGKIPGLAGLTNLKVLRLGDNQLTGPFPKELGDMSSLVHIDFSGNRLDGTIPSLPGSANLLSLKLDRNNFTGFEEPWLASPASLEYLSVSENQLEGVIPRSLASLPNLQFLNMSGNRLSANIPFGVSYNDATGPVPENALLLPHLTVLDVSHNNLVGELPLILPNSSLYDKAFFVGNAGLCGDPLPPCLSTKRTVLANVNGTTPDVVYVEKNGTGLQWWVLIIIGGSIVTAVGSVLAAAWRLRAYHKKQKRRQDRDLIKTVMRESAILMPLRQLRRATENFSERMQIGEGGCGTVYTGKLHDGTTVAVKRSKYEGSEQDKERFLNEVKILIQVNHRYLVKLLGCCMEKQIALLVFEFISNGTLRDHLRGKMPGAVSLTWKQRLKIAIQTADALSYLHSAATHPIYHRDVKSANIMLNDNLDAKVTDFGLSKLVPLDATHVSSLVQGTMGYIDPEYYSTYKITDKSDVYSYGVVLLELISAKPAIDRSRGEEETSLVLFAGPFIKSGDLRGLVDPTLTETYDDPTGLGRESILNVGRLAMRCLAMYSKERPSMKELWKELQSFWLHLNDVCIPLGSDIEDGTGNSQRREDIVFRAPHSSYNHSFRLKLQVDGSSIEMSQIPGPAT